MVCALHDIHVIHEQVRLSVCCPVQASAAVLAGELCSLQCPTRWLQAAAGHKRSLLHAVTCTAVLHNALDLGQQDRSRWWGSLAGSITTAMFAPLFRDTFAAVQASMAGREQRAAGTAAPETAEQQLAPQMCMALSSIMRAFRDVVDVTFPRRCATTSTYGSAVQSDMLPNRNVSCTGLLCAVSLLTSSSMPSTLRSLLHSDPPMTVELNLLLVALHQAVRIIDLHPQAKPHMSHSLLRNAALASAALGYTYRLLQDPQVWCQPGLLWLQMQRLE